MDPWRSAQDVLRCHHCGGSTGFPLFCDICNTHLCKTCVGEHLSDFSKKHGLVSFGRRGSTYTCLKHSSNICDLFCEQCDHPICKFCISFKEHHGHFVEDILKSLESKRHVLKMELQALVKTVQPIYQKIATNIQVQKVDLKKNNKIQITAIRKHGKDLHREIDNNIKKLEADLDEMDTELMTVLTKKEDEIAHISSEISKNIADLKNLIASNDVSVVSAHISRNAEFKKLIPKLKISLPRFTSQRINRETIQLGSLSVVSNETTEHNFVTDSPDNDSSSSERPTIVVSFVIKEINTTSGESGGFRSVSCLNDDNIWICGQDNIMQLYSLQGKLVKSINTKSGNRPEDIEVTRNGDLVYTDENDRTVNAVNNSHIETLIKTHEWTPSNVCNTFTGDILILLYNDHSKQTKVVRYSGSSEKQNIQFNDNGQALYSSHGSKCISENRNLDICVSDWGSNTVVVVNRAGNLRFVYTGPPSKTKESFTPHGITTDGQSQILIADYYNHRIHIIDQDGFFICFIEKWELQYPCGLCVDTKDNLIVTEYRTGKVKKIQYDV